VAEGVPFLVFAVEPFYDSTEKTAISKKGKIPKKTKKSKDLNYFKQKQMLSPELFKKLRGNDSFPHIRG
jgi:hypothetical protein